jgi:TP901 family phage tail tape measure protein
VETGATAIVGRGLVEILPDFRKWGQQLAADMRTARSQLDGSAAGLRRSAATVGNSMAKIGKGVGAVGVGVAAVSVKMAADFQAHTAVLQTAAGETSKGLAVVREGIKNIAVGTGTGIQNLTDGMYTIEKAGYRGSAGLQVLKAAAQGAREENAKLADVTNAMTSVMASYHLKASDSVRVMNAMKTAAGEGKITMEEFSGALSTVLPIASANHIAFEDVAGSMATLTQHGTTAREATHELAATIRALASPNNVASREMARFGLSAVDVSTKLGQRGLSGTVNMLVSTILSKMGPAGTRLQNAFEGTKQASQDAQLMLSKMSGETRKTAQAYLDGKEDIGTWNDAVKGAAVDQQPMLRNFRTLVDRSRGFSRELKLGGPATQTFTDALKKMSGGAIGLNTILQLTGESEAGNSERIKKVGESFHNSSKDVEGWKTTSKLLSVQLDRMKMQFQVIAINIGTKLIPVVSSIVGFFFQHKKAAADLAIGLGVLAGVMVSAYVAQKLYAVYTGIATAATWAFSTANGASRAQMLGLRLQLAALWVQERLQAVATGIATAAQWAWNAAMDANPIALIIIAIAALVGAIVYIATRTQWFQKLWGAIWGYIKAPVHAFTAWLKANWQLVVWTILTGGIGLAVAEIVRHWDGVKHAFNATIDWVKHNWPWLVGALGGPVGLAVVYIIKHWSEVKKGAEDTYHSVAGWFVRMGRDIGGFFEKLPGQLGRFFTQSVPSFFSSMWKSISGWFTALPGRLMSLVHQAATFQVVLALAGEQLIEGLFHGAENFFTKSVPAFFKTVWHGIVDFFKAVFGIHSPSTVMAALGMDLIRGLFLGIQFIASGAIKFLDTYVVKPMVTFFTVSLPNAAKWVWQQVVLFWTLLKIGVKLEFEWIRDHIFAPLGTFFLVTIPGWADWVRAKVTLAWAVLRAGMKIEYDWIRDHVFSPLGRFFTDTIPGWASTVRSKVVNYFGGMRDGVAGVYGWIRDHVFSPMGGFFTRTIPGWASTMKGKVVNFFGDMRDGLGYAWTGIESKAKIPINWVLDHVWNRGIYNVWDKIAGWIGIHNSLGKIRLLASGGTVGNEPVGMFNRPTAIVGEGNPSHPEYVIPTDPRYRARALALWKAAGAHFYASGGILGSIGGWLSSAASTVGSITKGALDFFTNPVSKAKSLLMHTLAGVENFAGSPWGKAIGQLPRRAIDGLVDAVKKVGADALGAIGLGSSGGSGVDRWKGVVQMALRMVGQPAALMGITLRRMNQESGGNPTIVNKWDSNWQAGHPSVGLMQVIGPTFDTYAGRFRNTGPFLYGVSVNPLANVYASMKYALSAYGSLMSAYGRAGGYRLGTMGATAGWHWLGEDGPELAKLPAGTRIRSARASQHTAPAAVRELHLTLHNHGVLGSQQEVENWLVASLTTIKRKGRMP